MTRTFLYLLVLCFSFTITACRLEAEMPLPAPTSTAITSTPSTTFIPSPTVPHSRTATPTSTTTPTPKPTITQQPSPTEPPAIAYADPDPTVTPALYAPFTVFVFDEAWLIEHASGHIRLQFNNLDWSSVTLDQFIPLFYEGGPALLHRSFDQCVISLNFGGGVPFDWSLETEEVQLGDHIYSRTTFRDANSDLQFVIYDMLFRVTFDVELDACLEAAEDILATYQLTSEND